MYAIEKQIPLPKHEKRVFPYDMMAIGDSFLVPDVSVSLMCKYNKAASIGGKHFVCRKQSGGVRVWRVE